MEGLTLRRELRIQATASTMLTYTFQKGHFFSPNADDPEGQQTFQQYLKDMYNYDQFRNIESFSKKNYRFTSVDHLTLSRNALEKVMVVFSRCASHYPES